MKRIKHLLAFLAVSPTFILTSQVTITSVDMPLLNDTIRVSVPRSFAGIQVQLSDTNYVWDYRFLMPDSQRVVEFVAPSATPYGNIFGTLFVPTKYGVRNYTPDPFPFILFGGVPENSYDFYNNSSANYRQPGYGITAMGQALPLVYSTPPFTLRPDIIYKFPLTYGNVDSSQSGFAYPLTGLGFYGVEKKRVNVVDGWGKLQLPYGEFDVIRVKSTIYQTDTIYLDTLGFGLQFARPVRYEFKWLGKGCKIPYLQVDATEFAGNITINSVFYRDSMWLDIAAQMISTSTCQGAKEGTMEVFSSGGKAPHTYSWDTGQNTKYISGLGEGVYTVTITDKYGRTSILTDTVEGKKQAIECLVIPSAFTPNDDLVNDVWNIHGLNEFPDCQVDIYNRWGSILYSSTGYAKPWDGRYKGENSAAATYYYTIKLQNKTYQGTVTIIR